VAENTTSPPGFNTSIFTGSAPARSAFTSVRTVKISGCMSMIEGPISAARRTTAPVSITRTEKLAVAATFNSSVFVPFTRSTST